jgi:tetratricopeptide (TPR) repeat protein
MSEPTLEGISVHRLCDQAQRLLDVKREAEAIPLLQRAIAAEPHGLRAHCLLALAFLCLGQANLALQTADGAVQVVPASEWPHRLRSLSLMALGRRRPALEAAQEAARWAPENPIVLRCLASAQLENRKKRPARETAARMLQVAPDLALTHETLGEVALAERKWRDAEAHYRRALMLNPQSWTAMNNLALALQHQRKLKESVERFHDAARLAPGVDVVRTNLRRSVSGYTGVRFFIGYLVIRILTTAAQGVPAHERVATVAGIAVVAVLAVAALFVRGRLRLRHLHPQVVAFYEDERRRDWRRLRHRLPARMALTLGSLVTAFWTLAWLTGGAKSAGLRSGGLLPYLLISGGTVTGIVASLRRRWRCRRREE